MITLKTLAKDNHGNPYTVLIRREERYSNGSKLQVVLDGAPSGWYLSNLIDSNSPHLSIDFGQKWDWINFQECMEEIRTLFCMNGGAE